ncbi:type II secretion system major pseudopilin GspG [soil metagenome]
MKNLKTRGFLRSAGFTLIELLVVLVILGLLAGLVGPSIIGKLSDSKHKAAGLGIQELSGKLDLFKLEVGRYPNTQEGLQALIQAPSGVTGWSGPYIRGSQAKDPWGNDYIYASPGQHNPNNFDLSSLGADKREGGEGENKDVTNWDK